MVPSLKRWISWLLCRPTVISVPAVRTQKFKERIASLLDTGDTARKIAGVTGTVIFMGLCISQFQS